MISSISHDLRTTPFSCFGTFLCLSYIDGDWAKRKGIEEGLWLRSIHGAGQNEIARLELVEKGQVVPFQISRTVSVLTLRGTTGKVDICISDSSTLRIRAEQASLRFDVPIFRNHGVIPEGKDSWIINLAGTFRSYRLISLGGSIDMDAPWETKRCRHIRALLSPSSNESSEFALEQLTWTRPPNQHEENFDDLAKAIEKDFETFAEPYQSCPEPFLPTALKAAHLNWSCVVPVGGMITRPAMFMSHNWMTNIWAWDHAFNALATQLNQPQLAWDQLMIFFDHQDQDGQIPDYFNDVNLLTTFVKPPIHGWILSLMIEHGGPLSHHQTKEAYEKLSLWTHWWLKFRNPDNDDLPVYWHGNDSGWDNGTSFDVAFPIKSPELASFLILQMELLSSFAHQLGKDDEAREWKQSSERLLSRLLETLWDGKHFSVLSTSTGEAAQNSDSVFRCLPIVLGDRLPLEVRSQLTNEIRRHVTKWGPATEHPESEKYEANGYWRGPIWAPPVLILVDGLTKAGESELAREISSHFCKLCEKSGFAENFNAITGEAQCDPAYTWTSSVFLILSMKYLNS